MINIKKFSDLDIYKIKDKYNSIVKSNMTFYNLDKFTSLLNLIGDTDYLLVDAYKTNNGKDYKIVYSDLVKS
jgi:hypothetical protein